jgi:cytochrome c556
MKRLQWGTALGVVLLSLAACETKKQVAMDPSQAIETRKTLMKDNARHWKVINDFVGKGVGTAGDVVTQAEAIRANARKITLDLFPAGTSIDEIPGKTNAKMEIWKDSTTFTKAASNLEQQAEKLADIAKGGDAAAIKTQFDSLSKGACGGCHGKFKVITP